MKKQPSVFLQYLLAFIIAVAFVTLIALRTNTMKPQSDGREYIEMGRYGVFTNPNLIAPFAYRPGMPYLGAAMSAIFSVDIKMGFRIAGWLSMVAMLMGIYTLSRVFISDWRKALLPMLLLGLSFYHIKFPLFFYSLVDVGAYPLILFSTWAFITRRYTLCLILTTIGVFFKEFLAIPMLLLMVQVGINYFKSKNRSDLYRFIITVAVGLSAILLPRLLIPVKSTEQFVDPLNDLSTLTNLVTAPFDEMRVFNIFFSLIAYWLPVLLLLTSARGIKVLNELKARGLLLWLLAFLVLDLTLTVYGGTNIPIFISYMLPLQVIVLSLLINEGPGVAEWVFAFVVMLMFNKILFLIPDPTVDIELYIAYYGGWSNRVDMRTLVRLANAGFFIALAAVIRYALPWISGYFKEKTQLS